MEWGPTLITGIVMLELLNIVFHLFHLSIIFINVFFWMSFRTLRIAQVTLVLTFLSWFGLGLVYGFGNCFLTEWHWQVKEKLGETNLPSSYIKLVVDRTFGTDVDPGLVDQWTMGILVFSLIGCIIQTIRHRKYISTGRAVNLLQ